MCSETIEIQGSGRTDAGVHATGQIFNFHTSADMSCAEMRDYMNQYLPEDIAVLEVIEVSNRFHSRLNAKAKTYSYHRNNSLIPNVFWRKYSITIEQPLDIQAMKNAATFLIGTHDFKSFTSTKKGKKSRTNPKLSGNIKLVVSPEYDLFLDTFTVTQIGRAHV